MPFFQIAKQHHCSFPVTFPPGVPHRCPMVSMDGCESTALLVQWRPFYLLLHSVPNRIPWLPFLDKSGIPSNYDSHFVPRRCRCVVGLIRLFWEADKITNSMKQSVLDYLPARSLFKCFRAAGLPLPSFPPPPALPINLSSSFGPQMHRGYRTESSASRREI